MASNITSPQHLGAQRRDFTKLCSLCDTPNGLRAKNCKQCGSEFSVKGKDLTKIFEHLSTKDGWTRLVFLVHENTLSNGKTKVFTHGYATRGTGQHIEHALGPKVFSTRQMILDGMREVKKKEKPSSSASQSPVIAPSVQSSNCANSLIPAPSLPVQCSVLPSSSSSSTVLQTTYQCPRRTSTNNSSLVASLSDVPLITTTATGTVSSQRLSSSQAISLNLTPCSLLADPPTTIPPSTSEKMLTDSSEQFGCQNTSTGSVPQGALSSTSSSPIATDLSLIPYKLSFVQFSAVPYPTTNPPVAQTIAISSSSFVLVQVLTFGGRKVFVLRKNKEDT